MAQRIRLLLVLWMVTQALPALAAKKMSVDQLQQAISAAQAAHRTDDALAKQLEDVKLTARLDSDALQPLLAASPGPRTSRALRALADDAIFLDPPLSQIPAKPAPDIAAQKAMLSRTVHYVASIQQSLPNFVATRVTEHYSDLSGGSSEGNPTVVVDGLYFMGVDEAPIAYREGRESDDPALLLQARNALERVKGGKARKTLVSSPPSHGGMSSWGEFGPILGVVLVDAAKGKLSWARWELNNAKPVAVFQFSIDRAISHYNVRYCCVPEDDVVNGKYIPGRSRQTPEYVGVGSLGKRPSTTVNQVSGYHGHLTIDPETGIVLRITIDADLLAEDAVQRAGMMVEYGEVPIGDREYDCPVRSVSLLAAQETFQSTPVSPLQTIQKHFLNDVQFTGYHRFGSESTLITDLSPEGAHGAESASAQPSAETSQPAAAPASAPDSSDPSSLAAASEGGETRAPASPPAPAVVEEEREVAIRPVDNLPGLAADADPVAPGSDKGSFTLNVTTRLVEVSLVATDKSGKPITDLKPDQVEIYDNGRSQRIAAFHHAGSGTPITAAQAAASGVFTNVTPQASQSGQTSEVAPDLLVLLIDESHLASNDLTQARGEMVRFLKATRPDAKLALYSIGDHGFRVIQDVTQDHRLVAARLAAWKPDPGAAARTQRLERREQQQALNVKEAEGLHGPNDIRTLGTVPDAIPLEDPDLATLGNNPLRASLEGLTALARHFAPVPGHKSLAWISGDRALAGLSAAYANSEAGKRSTLQLEGALAHTREALNDAHIALYVVDASMPTLVGGGLDPSRYGPGPEISPAASANQAPSGAGLPNLPGPSETAMQVDLAGIQGPLRALAQSTGGRAIARSDLVKALDGIEDESKALYEVAFAPDTPADGKFHALQINMPGSKGVRLRYRSGYLYKEEAASTKQRFQQSIWSPQDANAIKLTAEVVPSGSPSEPRGIKLSIALSGLALEEKDSRWRDQLYIFMAQRDDATQEAQVSGDSLHLALKPATYDSGMPGGIPYQRGVEIASKLGSVRVIVVDANSGRMGSVTLPASALNN